MEIEKVGLELDTAELELELEIEVELESELGSRTKLNSLVDGVS